MKITALHIQNFLSFGKAIVDLENSGLTIIEGAHTS